MYQICIVVIVSCFAIHVNSYVVLQVRKQDDNTSKIDVLVHKTVENDKIDELKQRISHKQFEKDNSTVDGRKSGVRSYEGLTNVLPGLKNILLEGNTPSDAADNVARKIIDFITKHNVKPKPITKSVVPRSKDQPAVVLNLNTDLLMNMVSNFLRSKTVHDYVNYITKNAAVVYRAVKDKLDADRSMSKSRVKYGGKSHKARKPVTPIDKKYSSSSSSESD